MKRTGLNRRTPLRNSAKNSNGKPRKRLKPNRKTVAECAKWSHRVLTRDAHVCRLCGSRAYHAHHVAQRSTSPRHRFDTDNGVALCYRCHSEVHDRRHPGYLVSDWQADEWLADGGQNQLARRTRNDRREHKKN